MTSKLAAALGTAGAKRDETPFEKFRRHLGMVRTDISGLVGDKNVDKFVRVCLNAAQSNPKILDPDPATRKSLLLSCLKAAQDGLLPDGREAVFNIYGTKNKQKSEAEGRAVYDNLVQYMPMAYGLIQKIYEAGATLVDAVAVYEKDAFKYQRGDEPKIEHIPYDGMEDAGKVKAAYCIVKLRTGETKREVMFRRDIEKVREKSKAPDGMMWKDFYDQGAIKSVIHRIVKQLPRAESLDTALAHDNEVVGLADAKEAPIETTGTNLEALVDGRLDQELRNAPLAGAAAPKEPVAADTSKITTGGSGGSGFGANTMIIEIDKSTIGGTAGGAGGGGGGGESRPAPKKGDPGTPEMKEKFLKRIEDATSSDTLNIAMDESRFFVWPEDLQKAIGEAYTAKLAKLEAE